MIYDSYGRIGIIVKYKSAPVEPSIEMKTSSIIDVGGVVNYYHNFINAASGFIPINMLSVLQTDLNVEYVEIDQIAYALAQTVPWGMSKINAPAVWSAGNKGTGIKIGVIDTGIDYNHPDLAANYKGGYNFVANTADPMDDHGHGTHVSGTIAALDNTIGVIGVAPEAWIYSLKVLNSSGSGSYSAIISAIDWCINNGMKIMNASLGGSSFSQTLKDACDKAWNAGLVFVAAAGNSGGTECPTTGGNVGYPAKFDSVIAVGATDSNDALASFSSRGPEVEISAPGVAILSTVPSGSCTMCDPSGYKQAQGTSMACPHATGVCALIWKANSSMTNVQVRECIGSTAIDLGTAGRDSCFGRGRIDANLAVGCMPGPAPRYRCDTVTNTCVQDPNGPYADLASCQAACGAPPITKYRCDTATGTCVQDPNGPYTDLASCQAACTAPPTGCTTAIKNIGDVVTLTASGGTGTAPFTITFKRNGAVLPGGTFTGVPSGVSKSLSYTTVAADSPTVTISVDVTDSCTNPGPQTCSKQCIVNVAAPPACILPKCQFNVV